MSISMFKRPGVLLVGVYLSKDSGSHSVGEDLAFRLRTGGWQVITASHRAARLTRLVDILATIWAQRNQYRVAQIDVYSGLAFIWAELAGLLLKKLHKPFVLTLRGGNLPQFASRWPKRVERLLRSSAIVTTPSGYLLDALKSYRQNLLLLPNPIDINAYEFQLRDTAKPKLIWLRAFHRIYNPSLAPRVLARVLLNFPNACLTMVGPDKGDGSLQETKRIAKDLGVLDRTEFPGCVPKNDVPKWLNKGDIFVNTTNVDNAPVSVIEAMACGLCVVSTNVGGMPYLVENGKDALLVPPDDMPTMAITIRSVLMEPSLAGTLSKNARQKAERFDWSNILPQWEAVLNSLLNNSKP